MTASVDRFLQPNACYNRCVQQPAGIYLHIPFCERKCTYCNFNTTDYFEDLARRYVESVSREIAYRGDSLSQPGHRVRADTIYFGGGTPSMIEADQIAALIDACRASFDVTRECEVTIEINPATFSSQKAARWLEAGVNRASVGVQSFLDRELISLSRTHTAGEARCSIDLLREEGFENISLDLIAGLPDQSPDDWEFNLRQALAIQPEHLSLYLLDLKEGTQLYSQIKRGQRPSPDDDQTAEMYRMICDATEAAGYDQYEISNFARIVEGATANRFRSKHNLKYWTGASFYGVGCGAHSYDGKARSFNLAQTEAYIEKVASTGQAVAERRELSEADRAVEALFMGLRLSEGIRLDEFKAEYGIDVIARYGNELPRLAEAGLIDIGEERLSLTPTGRLLSNEVFVSFV
ncbi:MAG: radical SAM family heme chaperone HemW [Blastocatellia bacterium]